MEYTMNGQELVIQLPERLTADRCTVIRSEIMEIIGKNSFTALCLDAQNTLYVSSSGLRIAIELLRKYEKVRVANASLEVFEVFEVTGLTELMEISKVKRSISVDGCKVIGRGKNGSVYRYNDDTIVKVYIKDDVTEEDIQREHLLSRKAFVLGVPTAMSFDTVTVGNRLGVMYELIGADSILDLLNEHPDDYDGYILRYAEGMKLITSIHSGRDPLLADKMQECLCWADDVREILSPEENEKVARMLHAIPDADTLVHGDYHPGNAMLQGDELVIIDMDTLGYGSPLIDVSGLYFTILCVEKVMGKDDYYTLPIALRERCWRLVTDYLFDDMDEGEKSRNVALAESLALVHALRFGKQRGAPKENIQLVKEELMRKIDLAGC